MKFLNLNTGYSFDGLWLNYTGWDDWKITERTIPKNQNYINAEIKKYNKITNTETFQIKYSSTKDINIAGTPDNESTSHFWYDEFAPYNTQLIATREKLAQSKGYIFWFPNEQSINITYSMPICALTETDEPLNLKIENNNVFYFINAAKDENNNESITDIDGYKFNEPDYSLKLITEPQKIEGTKYYAHVFNIACLSSNIGEFICKIYVGDEGYIRVGADFYCENEALYINLSNFGVELPDMIQKAIYDSNVHEDLKDNILINRKLKELMSNYWDIIANKGSYRSLKNSLEWFEWNNNLKVKEIWKHKEANITMFDDRELMTTLENKIQDSFTNFIKTNYISIYCALQEELDEYDDEFNPTLKDLVFKWSKEDIQLKLALLSKFFGHNFMPIHMNLLYSTVEDKVFTNTIKTLHGNTINRDDSFGSFDCVESNIKDNASYKLSNVSVQVTDNTIFGIRYPESKDTYFGVDKFSNFGLVCDEDESIKTFSTQYYTGPGTIIPIHLTISNQEAGDFIKETQIICTDSLGNVNTFNFNNIFKVKQNQINIKFNFLAKDAKTYEIKFTFILASSKTITKYIKFDVEDCDNVTLNMYKVHAKDDSKGFTKKDFADKSIQKYFYSIQDNEKTKDSLYTQYLPYLTPNNELYKDYNGIKLNRIIVIDLTDTTKIIDNNYKYSEVYKYKYVNSEFCDDFEILHDDFDHYEHGIYYIRAVLGDDYLEYARYENPNTPEEKLKYLMFISKKFFAESPKELYENKYGFNYKVIRDDLGFFPQFHYLELIKPKDTPSISDFSLYPYEAFCCAVEINDENGPKDFKYGHQIKDSEWTVINQSNIDTNTNTIEYSNSIRSPFIALNTKKTLDPGYYDISFKYCLDYNINKCVLKSAFRINKE